MARGREPRLLEEIFRQGLVLGQTYEKAPDPVGKAVVHLVEGAGLPRDEAADDVLLASHSFV